MSETTPPVARRILRTREAAIYLGIAESTLEKSRVSGIGGPPFVRLGARSVGYDLRELDAWIDRRVSASTSSRVGVAAERAAPTPAPN